MHRARNYKLLTNRNRKNDLTEWKNIIVEMKNTLEGIDTRLNETEQISEMVDRAVEITATEQK